MTYPEPKGSAIGNPSVTHAEPNGSPIRFDNGFTLTNERTDVLTDDYQDSGAKSHVLDAPEGVDNRVPKRVQMSRQHPWRADNPDAVIVARPSKWGNPYRLVRDDDGNWDVVEDGIVHDWDSNKDDARALAVEIFEMAVTGADDVEPPNYPIAQIRYELAGKDLACWCPLVDSDGQRVPCHADVLLELANPGWKP